MTQGLRRAVVALAAVMAVVAAPSGDPSSASASSPVPSGGPGGAWSPIFLDDFSGSSLDLSVWQPNWFGSSDTEVTRPPSTSSDSCADPARVTVAGGELRLRVQRRRCIGHRYGGAAVSSNPAGGGNFEFTYGYIEFRAILPAENGIWTALWTNGQNWPGDGEIDVMESGLPSASTQAWYYHRSSGVTGDGLTIPGASTRWHTYAAYWEPGRIRWYFDGNLVGTETSGVADVPHYVALTATDWRPANPSGPATTRVDYVRVWQPDTGPVTAASARISDQTLVISAAPGVSDDLQITRSSDSTLRVSNAPSAPYTGSGVDAAAGCTPSGDQAVDCIATHVTRIRVTAGDKPDRVRNLTGLRSTVYGEGGKDILIGGRNDDTLVGGAGADVIRGMDGNDLLRARDLASEAGINCDGGSSPGDQDQADLDRWPEDPNPRGCELRTRH